ncbi:MAG TPA: Nramp family divalent metal transporter [Armatimonadota bacterium]|nr:Nramp family divalent metal transporter [Armatimonadota bacterium]
MKFTDRLRRVGPAFIVGAVIIGPGSLSLFSKMGSKYGYQLLWLSLLAGAMMAGFIGLFMRFGVYCDDTFLGLTAKKLGRKYAAVTGVSVSLVSTIFQFGNCLGVTAALGLVLPGVPEIVWPVFFTVSSILFLFGFKVIYKVLERMMQAFLVLMLGAFIANLVIAKPDVGGIVTGLVPTLPANVNWLEVGGLIATTFVLVGASFQSYLVRAKGWTEDDMSAGATDTLMGSIIFTLIGSVIMMTAASVLYPDKEVKDAADMAEQLGGVFGSSAKYIFCAGFWAAAYSSFISNSLIGGVHLCDGLGLSEDGGDEPKPLLEQKWTKIFATGVLLVGMITAIAILLTAPTNGESDIKVTAIMLAQAVTLLAIPLAAVAAVLVLFDAKATKDRPLAPWAKGFVVFGVVLLLANVVMTAVKLWPKVFG